MAQNSQVNIGIKFKSDTKEVESSLDKLKKSLQDLQKVKLGDFKGSAEELDRVKETAQKVESILGRAFNPTLNTTNISTFNNELKKSNLTIEQIKSDFSQFGKEGELAFSRMASSLLTTNLKLKETNSLIDSMGKTMINTVKWGIASSVMNTFTQSVQGAFQYVQSLERSLTNIRIVTGDSTEKMAQFAEQANRSAQALGRSTLDYTKASLTFYQQGLNDQDVQARTEATLKAQNITGAGQQMADYLTSVWNGYKVANEEAELYVDKLAAVADSSASDMSQLAIAMSKVASTANAMGVDVDQLNAQIATVVATTRQAPESVGTAFKTIYTRMNDIKTGSDEAEISLGRYSGTMANLGFNVLDATGHLRDTGQVMEEIGGRWKDLTREQQIYLAQTMGGQRQVNQLMALFDNWTTYSELLNTSLESEGTLTEKNARYMESLGAKMEQLGAAGERVKDSLIDTDSIKGIVDILTDVTNLTATLFESIGGGNNVLLAFGSVATQVFGGTISKEIAHMIEGFQNARTNVEILKNDIALTKTFENSQGENTKGLQFVQENMKELQKYYSILDESAINEQKNIIDRIGVLKDEQAQLQQNQTAVREYAKRIGEVEESQAAFNDSQNFSNTNIELGNLIENAKVLKQQYDILKNSGFTNNEELEKFKTHFQELLDDSEKLGINVDKVRQAFNSGNWAEIGVSKIFDEAIQKGELFSTTINKSGNALEDTTNKINNLTSVMQSKQKSFETLFNVNTAIKFASTVGQIGSIMTSITNLGSIIKNEDLSASEKLAKVLTNGVYTLMMGYNIFKNISEITGIQSALSLRQLAVRTKDLAIEKLQTAEAKKRAALQHLITLEISAQSTLKERQAAEQAFNKANKQFEKAKEQVEKATAGLQEFGSKGTVIFSTLKSSISSFIDVLGSIAGPLLAITAIAATAYTLYKAYNQASDAAKEAAKNAKFAKEEYDKAKESFKDLISSIEDYADAKNALSELTSGTEQWYNKIDELNDKVLQLLQKFPELAKYITTTEDGLLQISDKGLEEVKDTYRQRAYTAGMANANLQGKSYQAERNADITEQGRRIYGTFGMFGGKDVMEAVLSAVQKKGTRILGDEETLKAAVAEEGINLNQDQINATIRNTQQIIKLNSSLEAEKTQVDALRDSLVKTNLINEEAYRNSQNKEAFADIVSKAIDQERENGLKQFEKQQVDMYGNVIKYLDPNAIIEKYEELSGNEVQQKGNKISTRQAGSNEEFKETSFAEIRAYVEEASVDMEKILADATERMAAAQQNFAGVSDRVKEVLFNSGLAGGFDKVNTDSLSQVDVNRLKGLNQNDLADFLGIDVKEIPGKLKELGTSVQEGLDSFINGIEEGNTRAVMLQLKDKYGADLSKELAETIAQNVQDGYQKVGNESGNAIRDFYKKLSGDQVDDIAKLTEEYNYAGNSAEDFIKAVREIGVTSEKISDDMVRAFYDAQSKIQDVSSKANRLNLDKVNAGSSTAGLAQKVQNGENLSDKELESMKEGLEDLKKVYPSLTKEVETLKNAQLSGTQSYQESLRKLKAALMASYEDMLKLNEVDYSQISDSLKGLIATTEDLQNARGRGLLTEETNSEIIINLASKYQSCKNQIEKYTLALQSHDEQLKFTQGLNLETALRSAELAQKYGLEANSIEELSRHYQELWMQQGSNRQNIQKNAELATEAAVAYMRLNQGIETLQKSYSDVETVLDTLEQYDIEEVLGDVDLGKKFEEIRKSVADLLNTSEDLIDSDFIKKYTKQIKSLASGSEDAEQSLAQLQKGIAELSTEDLYENLEKNNLIQDLHTIKVDLDDDGFNETLLEDQNKLNEWLQSIPQGELSLNDLNAINSLINLMQQAGWSAAEIEQYFKNQNIDLDIMDAEAALATLQSECGQAAQSMAEALGINTEVVTEENKNTDVIQTPTQEGHWDAVRATFSYPTFSAVPAGPFGGVNVEVGEKTSEVVGQQWVTKPDVEQTQASSSRTAVALSAVAGNKRGFGGGISHKNKSGGNKKSSGGGKGKGGKGGGGKAKQPNRAKGETRKPDRYRNNTVKANKLANSMEKLQKQQERLGGKATLDNLEKQLQILKQQNNNIKQRTVLQRNEQTELANHLKKYGATFKDGTLSNYFKVHAKIMDEYNKKLTKWNSASADWQEKNKEFLNNAKEVMDNALKDLERYDKLQQEIAKSIQESKDNAQEQINTKLKQFEIKIEASLDLANVKRDWNKFKRDIIDEVRDDDILGLNKYRFADLSSYFNDAQTGSIQQLKKHLEDLVGDGSLNRSIFSATYEYQDLKNRIQHKTLTDRQSWLEEIEKVSKDLESQMEGFKDVVDEIKESIFDTIDAVQDAFDEQMDEYEYLGDLINHNMKVAEMMYGDQAYDQMAKYYDKIEQNNNKQLEFLRQQKDLWYSRMHEEQARMARIASQQGTDSNAYKESRDRFKEYEKHWMDSVKNLNSMIEDSLDNIIDKYANAINDIFLKFELNLGNGKTFDDIGDEWDMINDKADMFLDKINSAYQIEKLQNAFEDAIGDNEGDIAAQQALNNLMEQQLAYLKDKDKLTQYDVDRANTLLQIEIKRLALQQARSNKNKLRLRRDSQGNYTYQYTADTEAMNKAEQDLADARISLYNSDKAAYVDNLSAIQKSANDIKDKLEDIWTDENLSKEEKLQKSYELEKYYGEKINDLLAENASIRNNLIDSGFEDLARIYNMSVEDLKGLPQDQQDAIFKNLIPQANSAVAQMVQSLAEAGGFSGFFDNLLAPLTQAFDDRTASMAEIQEQSQQVLGDITSDYDTLIGQTERLLDNNQQLVKSQEQQLTRVQNQLLYVENILKTYQDIKDTIAETLKLGYQVQEKDALGVLGVSRKADQEATDKQNTALQDYLSRETSTSDLGSDYTPYKSNWHSDNFMAGLESSNVDEASILTGQTNNNLNSSVQTSPQTNISNVLDSINSNIFDSINNTLNIILKTNRDYYAQSLNQQEAIEKAIIANQTVHIDADFPNARDVSQIIDAINNLTLVAAQKAGK